MSSYSRSNRNRNVYGGYGSNHYQRKGGLMGNLFNMLGSRSDRRYGDQYNGNPAQTPNPSGPNMGTSTCSACGANIPGGSKFCLQCGAKVNIALFCMNCGEQLPGNAKFCLKCGTKVT